jgi:hypothetical protein
MGVSPFTPCALYKDAAIPYAFQYLVTCLFHFNFPTLVDPAPGVGSTERGSECGGRLAVNGSARADTSTVGPDRMSGDERSTRRRSR